MSPAGVITLLTSTDDINEGVPRMSPDGTRIVYLHSWNSDPKGVRFEIGVMNADGSSPHIVKDLGFSYSQVGLLSSALSFSWAISAYLGGVLSDRTGVRKGVQVGGAELGKNVQIIETNAGGDVGKEASFIDRLVSAGVQAIILSAVSPEGSVRAIKRAHEAGITEGVHDPLPGDRVQVVARIADDCPAETVWLAE